MYFLQKQDEAYQRIIEFGSADVQSDSRPVRPWVCYRVYNIARPPDDQLTYVVRHVSEEAPLLGVAIYSRLTKREALSDRPF
ncbi:MAG: hypothetical protein ACOCXZ_04220 [Chloroflexota bacterium]